MTQARAQAVYFSELIREYPYDCRPAVDCEQYGTLSKGELNGIALAFAETLEERTGKTPAFYTNASSAAEIWGTADAASSDCGLGPRTDPLANGNTVVGSA